MTLIGEVWEVLGASASASGYFENRRRKDTEKTSHPATDAGRSNSNSNSAQIEIGKTLHYI